jgi:elongation factor Tu
MLIVRIDEAAALHWPDGTEHADSKMVMPGDNVEMQCDIYNPLLWRVDNDSTSGRAAERLLLG